MSYNTHVYVLACLDDRPSDLGEICERMGMLSKAMLHCPFTEGGVAKSLEWLAKHRLAVESAPGRWKRGRLEDASAYRDEIERVREARRERFKAQGRPYYYEEDPIAAEERDRWREDLSRRAKNSVSPRRMP